MNSSYSSPQLRRITLEKQGLTGASEYSHPQTDDSENIDPQLCATPSVRTENDFSKMPSDESLLISLAQRKRRFLEDASSSRQEPAKRPLTTPKSPVLQTRIRVQMATTSTLKNNALKDISHGYKANKVNRRIFESSGDLGVPKVTKRPLTVPKSPNLSKRAPTPVRTSTPLGSISSNQHQQHHRQQQQQKQQERNSAVKKTHVVTQHGLVSCAESARRLSAEKMKREEHQDVANADVDDQLQQEPEHVVEYEVPIRAETPEDQDTNEPLERARSMTPRHRETLHGPSMQRSRSQPPRHPDALRGSFMQRSRSQTPRHADALHGPPQRRARSQTPKPSLTVPIPFKFETDIRGERYQEQFRQRLEKWKEMEKESHHFKAHPRPVYPEKEEPKKSTKPLTQAQTIHLWTDDRARRREEFERERRMKEQLVQEMIAEKAREDELRQQQETRELRKQLVAHPVPIRHYQPIHIHRSTRPLTVPHSPNIGDKRKKQMMAEREAALAQEQAHQFDDQR